MLTIYLILSAVLLLPLFVQERRVVRIAISDKADQLQKRSRY